METCGVQLLAEIGATVFRLRVVTGGGLQRLAGGSRFLRGGDVGLGLAAGAGFAAAMVGPEVMLDVEGGGSWGRK